MHDYKQKKGIDYHATWAKVVKATFFRILFDIVATRRMRVEQMNIVTAFLYELLDEDVYVTQLDDFIEDLELVCHLLKALYGLKQAPRVWYEVIRIFLKELSFESIEFDHSVFVSKDKKIFIAIYVDDFLIISVDMAYINVIKIKLRERFQMIDLESAQHYLDIEIIRTDDFITLRQTTYLRKVLERFGMNKCKIVDFSMESSLVVVMMFIEEGQTTHVDTVHWYGAAVGCLMYAMTMTRPNLAYALFVVSRYCHNLDSTHVVAIQRIFRYLQSTLDIGISYDPNQKKFHDYSDADWDGVVNDRESIGVYIYFIVDELVSWCSKRQIVIALSSCEFEYYALFEASKEAIWLRRLLTETNQISTGSSLI